jgi:uncharacterized repeat protein (TIGR03806 family)
MKALVARCIAVWMIVLSSFSVAHGALVRVPNTTLTNVPPTPPTFGYAMANALGSLNFTNPVTIVTPPGETNRIFVLEKRGRIIVITNLAAPNRTIFMNITDRVRTDDTVPDERGLLGLAFHPGYATNRYFYLYYTSTNTASSGGLLHDILSRFEISAGNPNLGDTNSELVLIRQRDEASNHNGGDLHFGPQDGYLYLSLGDEGDANDTRQNSQRITKDFFSAILRLDVDKRPGSLNPNPHASIVAPTNYAVPPDNPFVGATSFNGSAVNSNQVRTEFWAVGLRNPWRMAFDEETGILYCGDVGQGTREEISIIEKGKNYGWNYWEGFFQRTNSAQIPVGFVHTRPLTDYDRSLGAAVTGGRVYRGFNLSQLYGAYVYADYVSGRIWALRHTGTNVTQNTILNLNDPGIVSFGVDPRNGDLLYADQSGTGSTIDRLIYNASQTGAPLPATLAAVGAFSDLTNLTPQSGIVAYDVNVPFWSDNAIKSRWFSLPNTNLTMTFEREGNWQFPTGTVWIKHFELELTNGVPESRKRIETRLLVKNATGGYGITYRWGNSVTNATLVAEGGLDESFVINESGILRTQVWRYPSRIECLQCHTAAGGFAIGFNTAQLNRDFDYGGTVTNQLAALSDAGYFNTNVTGRHTLRALAHPTNTTASLESRVRSYLAANCVQCHQPSGPALGTWDARVHTPGPLAGIIDGALIDSYGSTNNRVIAPGAIAHSVLLTRIATRGTGQMPPLGSSLVDAQGVDLIAAWITNDLPSHLTYAEWQLAQFGSTNAPDSSPDEDADGDRAGNYLEYLTATDPNADTNFWGIDAQPANGNVNIVFPQIANRAFEIQSTTNLFDAAAWQPLDLPGNEPFFWVTNRTGVIQVVTTNAPATYFRARVFEP